MLIERVLAHQYTRVDIFNIVQRDWSLDRERKIRFMNILNQLNADKGITDIRFLRNKQKHQHCRMSFNRTLKDSFTVCDFRWIKCCLKSKFCHPCNQNKRHDMEMGLGNLDSQFPDLFPQSKCSRKNFKSCAIGIMPLDGQPVNY